MPGRVKVKQEYCKGCGLCVHACPPGILVMGQSANGKGYYAVEMLDEAKCKGCAFCALICPDLALEVFMLEKGE
ncbi:MAG: 4Fe-4S binding protein [Desulfitobacteriaceae bacterium]